MLENLDGNSSLKLFEKIRRGDTEAFGAFFEKHRSAMLRTARRRLGRIAKRVCPADVVQDTFFRTYQHIDEFQGCTESELVAWLNRSLASVIVNCRRFHHQQKRSVVKEEPRPSGGHAVTLDAPSHSISLGEELSALRRSIVNLSAKDRRILDMRNREDRSFVEIGARLGMTPDAVRMAWRRALKSLRADVLATIPKHG